MAHEVRVRGVRGATTADENTREAIVTATRELMSQLIEANRIAAEDVASAIFTTTADLNAEYPAVAARTLGWSDVALLCAHEINVPQSVPLCIRVLIHWHTAVRADEIQHVYLKGAVKLRPDRVKPV